MHTSTLIAVFDKSLAFAGFQRDAVNLAIGFSRLGYSVDLILARKPEDDCLWELPESVSLLELGIGRAIEALIPLSRYLRRRRPKVLICTSTESSLVALLACIVARVKTEVVARETAIWSLQGDPRLRGRLVHLLASYWFRRLSNVVAISQTVKTDLCRSMGLLPEGVRVIHNPAVTPGVYSRAQEPVDHPWLQSGMPPVVLSAGRLHRHKDFPTLLRAFRLVRQHRPARLVILGEGPERSALELLARELGITEDLDLPGFVGNPFKFMSRAAVFVLCSPAESFGNVLAEALACGTPVVSTDCPGGPSEILDRGAYGRLVPVGDVHAIAEAVENTLDEHPSREHLQQAAARFSCDHIAREYLSLPAFSEEVP